MNINITKLILLSMPFILLTAPTKALTNQEIYNGYKAIGHLGYCVKEFRDNGYNFEASRTDGYKTVLEIQMPKATNQNQRELTTKWAVEGDNNGYKQGLRGCKKAYNDTFNQ